MQTSPILEAGGLTKSFGGLMAVADASISLQKGEIKALIGPNGAGKTTLFNLLSGQLKADGGSIYFDGERISGLPPHRIWRKGLSRTFQIPATFVSKTVFENIQIAILSHRRAIRKCFVYRGRMEEERTQSILETVGLPEHADMIAGFLSYGDVKKLELAIALANEPKLLLLDEPTAGMAPAERDQLMTLVRRIAKGRDLTVLFTEHDMDVVFSAAQRITVMHQGAIVAEGDPEEVRANPEVRAIYLGEDA